MMDNKQKVLLLGAHGETGGEILAGLLEDGGFDISILVQPSSVSKPAVQALASRGLPVVVGDLSGSIDALAEALAGFDTVVSAIAAPHLRAQLALVDAAAKAGIKRFVPCDFGIPVAPGGLMWLRDEKEVVHQRIWQAHLPYTFIDVGYWHQLSFFRVPSGRLDYALAFDAPSIFGDGNTPTLLSDKRDIGLFTARILHDTRTLNRSVIAWSDSLTQNAIHALVASKTGEQPLVSRVPAQNLEAAIAATRKAHHEDPGDEFTRVKLMYGEYSRAKWVRGDATLENARYLGYLDARELYPDLRPRGFGEFLDEVVEGKVERPYGARSMVPDGGQGIQVQERIVPVLKME